MAGVTNTGGQYQSYPLAQMLLLEGAITEVSRRRGQTEGMVGLPVCRSCQTGPRRIQVHATMMLYFNHSQDRSSFSWLSVSYPPLTACRWCLFPSYHPRAIERVHVSSASTKKEARRHDGAEYTGVAYNRSETLGILLVQLQVPNGTSTERTVARTTGDTRLCECTFCTDTPWARTASANASCARSLSTAYAR